MPGETEQTVPDRSEQPRPDERPQRVPLREERGYQTTQDTSDHWRDNDSSGGSDSQQR